MITKADLPEGVRLRMRMSERPHGGSVEIGYWPGRGVVVAHSKEGSNGAVLLFTVREWEEFIKNLPTGEFPSGEFPAAG
ncbi:hypothetical protein [Nocardia sp. NBC_00511]|uniref:hypothetical protein n=1 Tax=Nocardia sp. NBC_00511 TaxID=2903591 RepID=UPI0030E536F9